ncbi:MAG: TIGR04211 family SH3 domain-containing protein [Methylococcales bacterium]|nr:TIGR04211 family SH3 domain-containing protein [Methylococcales bacterium]
MRKSLIALSLTLLLNVWLAPKLHAKTVYVTDNLKLTLRTQQDNRSKILKMLPSGTALTLLEELTSGYSRVRTETGVEGYFLTRYLIDQLPARKKLDNAQSEIATLKEKNQELKAEISNLRGEDSEQYITTTKTLQEERDRLSLELAQIKHTAEHALEIQQQRDQFQERLVEAERELEQLRRANMSLKDSARQDWFLYGGLLALGGVLLGIILPKLRVGRRQRDWNTF